MHGCVQAHLSLGVGCARTAAATEQLVAQGPLKEQSPLQCNRTHPTEHGKSFFAGGNRRQKGRSKRARELKRAFVFSPRGVFFFVGAAYHPTSGRQPATQTAARVKAQSVGCEVMGKVWRRCAPVVVASPVTRRSVREGARRAHG